MATLASSLKNDLDMCDRSKLNPYGMSIKSLFEAFKIYCFEVLDLAFFGQSFFIDSCYFLLEIVHRIVFLTSLNNGDRLILSRKEKTGVTFGYS